MEIRHSRRLKIDRGGQAVANGSLRDIAGAGTEAIFILNCPAGPPILRGSAGFTTVELNRIASVLANNLATLCAEWERIHVDH